jgi:N-acetylglucosamine-6-sulfatase
VNTDFAPTFAELVGTEFGSVDGRSLAPLLRGEDSPWRPAVLLERLPANEGDEEDEAKGKTESKANGKAGGGGKAGPAGASPFEAVRTETDKYVEYENGEKELYDLEADPYELENIIDGADPSLVDDLKARLEALRSCTGDACREAEDAS